MDVLHPCCAGLDVHKKTVVACVRRVHPAGKVTTKVQTFATMTGDLLALADWLAAQGVATLAMESTGSYWKPVFNILEAGFTVILVNAHHIKQGNIRCQNSLCKIRCQNSLSPPTSCRDLSLGHGTTTPTER